MSHTFYDSPCDQEGPRLSIDVSHEYVWFFGYEDGLMSIVRIGREELPAVARAINGYLRADKRTSA
jgi:hypothetical protein